MRNTGKVRRLASGFMAAAMVMSMNGMTAWAANIENAKVEITKTVEKQENTYLPAAEFEFEATYVGELTGTKNADGTAIDPQDNLITLDKTSISPVEADENLTAKSVTLSDKITISVNENYKIPGTYQYKITEKPGNYDGIVYDTSEKYFNVYVGEDGPYAYIFQTEEGGNTVKGDGNFINRYGVDENGVPSEGVGNLTLTKQVSGNQSSKDKSFEFEIMIENDATDLKTDASERYYVTFSNDAEPLTLTSKESQKISLKAGETATIHGISETDTYTIKETSYMDDGYDKVSVSGADSGEINELTVTDEILTVTGTGADTITYINIKNVITPTGIVLSCAPYIFMVFLAVVFAALFLRRKREEF